jgi:LmbE family N-acetylglucosaminyl deacetylase
MDGEVTNELTLRHDITRVIRQLQPQVVITHPPQIDVSSVYGSHADHVATGQATWAAVYPDARNPFAFPELITSGYQPWSADEIWLINHPLANLTVDITDQFDRKIRALLCHASQHEHPAGMADRVRAWNMANAQLGGLPEGSLAERFFVADAR